MESAGALLLEARIDKELESSVPAEVPPFLMLPANEMINTEKYLQVTELKFTPICSAN